MSRKKIEDEFAEMNISRQRKYQLRRAAAGLCWFCGAPAVERDGKPTKRCLKHLVRSREWKRSRGSPHARRRRGAPTYQLQAAKVHTHFFPPELMGATLCGMNSPELRGESSPYEVTCPACFKQYPKWQESEYERSKRISKA